MLEQIITSSVLIGVVMLLSVLFEKRMSPCTRYALWLLVAVKLLVPLPTFESPISVLNVVKLVEESVLEESVSDGVSSVETHVAGMIEGNGTAIDWSGNISNSTGANTENSTGIGTGITAENITGNKGGNNSTENSAGNSAEINIGNYVTSNIASNLKNNIDDNARHNIFYLIWFTGILLCASIFLWSNLRFAGTLKKNRIHEGCVREKLNIYRASDIESPCLFGAFRPAIYLPMNHQMTEEQRKHVLVHECAHYRQGDHIWAVIRCLCVIIHWYNPLVWMAAVKSMRDSEQACDAVTLRTIGAENYAGYGKTLIELARKMSGRASRMNVLGCSTGAAGGVKEMKGRMQLIVKQPRTKWGTGLAILLICVSLVGCTFGGEMESENLSEEKSASESYVADMSSESTDDMANQESGNQTAKALEELNEQINKLQEQISVEAVMELNEKEIEALQEELEKLKRELVQIRIRAEVKVQEDNQQQNNTEEQTGSTPQHTFLEEQPEADKICIKVAPSILREQLNYYYIPDGEDQEWLLNRVQTLDLTGKPYERRWEGKKETGWTIVYNDMELMVFEGGYLYRQQSGEDGMEEIFIEDPKLCDYIQVMLLEKLNYYKFDPTEIKDIVSAKLEVQNNFTDNNYYSQTITGEETLKLFEEWFSEADYVWGGVDCYNQGTCLELTMKSGEVVALSMAGDDCANFGINGVYYDYRPHGEWYSNYFYELFDEIPWGWSE